MADGGGMTGARAPGGGDDRATVAGLAFLGATSLPTGVTFGGLEIGGLSALAYDAGTGRYLALADDRSADARFFRLRIDLADGALGDGDVRFTGVRTLSRRDGSPFADGSLDPEGLVLGADGRLVVASEGDAAAGIDPFVRLFGLDGRQRGALPVDAKFLPAADGLSGVRANLAFEGLTLTPDGRTLYVATENALAQDGPAASLASGSASRIVRYDAATGEAVAEYVYVTEPVARTPVPAGDFATNGLVELLAIDDAGTLLALERSFSVGVGNTIKLFLVRTQGATDVSGTDAIEAEPEDGELEVNLDAPVQKELLLDLGELGIPLDNVEGMAFGPDLPDGRKTLVLVSDNNFSATQVTQFLAFAVELDGIPTITPLDETPSEPRYDGPADATEGPDPDDPAVYLDPDDPAASAIFTAMKNGGLRTYDLAGRELGRLEPDGIRYNNVDLLYGVRLGGERVDLLVASDRANDTLAIFRIDPDTKALTDVTAPGILGTIFGVDDGEATAYGLASYTSPVDGRHYAFVTQASGAAVAQLEIADDGAGGATARLVRLLPLPVADGDDPADYQSEGIAIDRETGVGYVTGEGELGLLAFDAEPTGSDGFRTIAAIDSGFFEPDLEGVSVLYGEGGRGALLVSSQGDSTFAAFDRGTGAYLGSFAIGPTQDGGLDGVEESDGLDVFAGSLGGDFPNGLLVTQDGSNEPQLVFPDPEDGEVQNFNSNFKLTDLSDVVAALGLAAPDAGFDPRDLPAVARDDAAATGFRRPVFVDALANDADLDGPLGPAELAGPATGGLALLAADGRLLFVADAKVAGAASFAYRVTDGDGGASVPATVTVEVGRPAAFDRGGDGRDRLEGDGGADYLSGRGGRDRLAGRGGDDLLAGWGGSDRLAGGDGADVLVGGAGRNRLAGGDGADLFLVDAAAGFARAVDFDAAGDGDRLLLAIPDLIGSDGRVDGARLRATDRGGDLVVAADLDGTGAFTTLARLAGAAGLDLPDVLGNAIA